MPGKRVRWTNGRIIGVCLVLIGSVIIGLSGLYWSVSTAAEAIRNNARPADFIVVLGAGVWPGGEPSPALRARTQLGISLYHQGYADYLVMTGGVGTNPPAEAEVMRQLALDAGVPPAAIIVENQARSTQENASLVKALAEPHGWKSALVVSDPFHLPRSSWMFSDAGFAVSTAGTNDYYYGRDARVYQTARECFGLIVYALQRPFLALSSD